MIIMTIIDANSYADLEFYLSKKVNIKVIDLFTLIKIYNFTKDITLIIITF